MVGEAPAEVVSPAAPAAQAATPAQEPAAPAPVAPASTDWTASLPDSAKAYVQTKGFKDPATVIESYQNFEKLMGAPKDKLLRIPDKPDAPEWNDFYEKLGRPKNSNEYQFKVPEGQTLNKEFTEFAQKLFHGTGLTKTQGEAIAAKWNEYAMGDIQKQAEQKASNIKVEDGALRKEWGVAYGDKMKNCNKAAQSFGLAKEDIDSLENAWGYSKTLKLLDAVGAKLGEDSFVTGDAGGFKGALTPDQAKAEIASLKNDQDFLRRFKAGDTEAIARLTKLHTFAHPEQDLD